MHRYMDRKPVYDVFIEYIYIIHIEFIMYNINDEYKDR